jgi:FkbM family methyltransferase
MIKKILRNTGLFVYLKYYRLKYFPSKTQLEDKKHVQGRLSFYGQFLKSGDVCFDVGANIGNRTEIFLALGAKVIAIEPQRECAKMLRLRFGSKITLVQAALGEKETVAEMYISETSEISSLSKEWIDSVSKTRFRESLWNKREIVTVMTLDKLIASYGLPKFCKIDVEGYEDEVLKGLSRGIDIISFEYTIPERLASIINCLTLLSKLGSYECNYTIGEQMKLEMSKWVSKETIVEKIRQASERSLFGDIYVRFVS